MTRNTDYKYTECDTCRNTVAWMEDGSCPACTLLDEYGTLELAPSVYTSMPRYERESVEELFDLIPGERKTQDPGDVAEQQRLLDEPIVIDTPEGIAYFHALQLKYALSIEIKTGMKHGNGSPMKQVNKAYGTRFTRKQAAFDFISAICDYMKGDPTAHERINAIVAPQGLVFELENMHDE